MSKLFLLYPHIFPPESFNTSCIQKERSLSLARPVCYEMCPLLRTQETDSVKLLRHYVREFVRKTGAPPWIKPSTKSRFNLPQNRRNHSIIFCLSLNFHECDLCFKLSTLQACLRDKDYFELTQFPRK